MKVKSRLTHDWIMTCPGNSLELVCQKCGESYITPDATILCPKTEKQITKLEVIKGGKT